MQKMWIVESRVKGSSDDWEAYKTYCAATYTHVPALYTTEFQADQTASYLNRDNLGGYSTAEARVREMTADDWKALASRRFAHREWELTYWTDSGRFAWLARGSEVLKRHFPHVAKGDPTKVAFIENDEKGKADRITVMKPGRFLTKFFSDVLTPEEIGELANKYTARSQPGELKFAHTADEIEKVYTTGPSSCMAYGVDHYSSSEHPVRVYAAGDLAVAYIVRGDITARALCWPDKKIFGRIYGDADRLRPALEALGYDDRRYLSGAKLLRIEDGDGLICPYLDGECSVTDHGDYLTIGGDLSADSTTGIIEDYGQTCDCCGERIRDDEYYYVNTSQYSEGLWCSSCESNDAIYSEAENITVAAASATRLENDEWVSDWHFEANGFTCEGNGNRYLDNELVVLADGTHWSNDYFEDHGACCGVDSEAHRLDDMVHHDDLGMIHKDTPEAKALLLEEEGQEKFDLQVA